MKAQRFPIAAASGHHLTTNAAFDVLDAGGTAVDAAIAGALMACVVEPVLAGPMGGGCLMLRPDRGAARVLDGFVQTPRRRIEGDVHSVEADFGDTTQVFHIGAGTVATPGLVPMLFDAHDRAGRIPIRELAAPAIDAARKGHPLNAFQFEVARIVAPVLDATPEAQRRFGRGDGTSPEVGAALCCQDLADVFEVLAIEGPRLFTEGEVAQALLSLDGVALSAEDLRRYRPIWRTPIEVTRAGWTIALPPAPSIGGAQIALMLDAADTSTTPSSLTRAQRALLRLRGTLEGPVTFDEAMVAQMRRMLADHPPRQRGTTHISVTDRDGLGAALTLSNGTGAGVILPGTGIMPNNMLGEEDLLPAGPGSWPLDTRLASAMSPLALTHPDGAVTMLGSGGSSRIRTALSQTILHMIAGQSLEQAIHAPRLHLDAASGPVQVEAGEAAWMDALAGIEGDVAIWNEPSMYFGGVHGTSRTPRGRIAAIGDPRRDGAART